MVYTKVNYDNLQTLVSFVAGGKAALEHAKRQLERNEEELARELKILRAECVLAIEQKLFPAGDKNEEFTCACTFDFEDRAVDVLLTGVPKSVALAERANLMLTAAFSWHDIPLRVRDYEVNWLREG